MTVEIKQLVIRAIAEPSRRAVEVEPRPAPSQPLDPRLDQAAIVEACVREVLRELERRRRR